MPELTPEEKKKLYEEEKIRLEAQEKLAKEKKQKQQGTGCLIIILLIAVIWIGERVSSCGSSKPAASTKTAKKAEQPAKKIEKVWQSEWDGSVYQVVAYLKKNLVDPKSYEGIEWSPLTKLDAVEYKYSVRHKYRAKNSFGGYVIENRVFFLDKDGNVVNVVSWD